MTRTNEYEPARRTSTDDAAIVGCSKCAWSYSGGSWGAVVHFLKHQVGHASERLH